MEQHRVDRIHGHSSCHRGKKKEKEKALDNIVMRSQRGTLLSKRRKVPKKQDLSPAEQEERRRQVEEILKKMEENLRHINRPLPQSLKVELGKSKRGEHVFNTDILKFYSKVLRRFLEKNNNIQSLQGYESEKQTLNTFGEHTLSPDTEYDIQTKMVVELDPYEFYVNANGKLYGEFSKVLREAFLNVLDVQDPSGETANKQRVTLIIENMNNYQIYVDEMIKKEMDRG
ncbi:uncharacterized protein LOC122141291 [Tachysurus ichikawai]